MTSPLRTIPDLVASVAREPLGRAADVAKTLAVRVEERPLKDLLSGTWLGHPLHPVLTDVTLGAWASAGILDVLGGERSADASTKLIGLGVLSAAPTAVSGLSDWAGLDGEERRVGIAHAVGNVAATAIYGASWLARKGGTRRLGIALALLGGGVAAGTAYFGGHLVYARGVGVDWTAFDRIPKKWTPVMDAEELAEDKPAVANVKGVEVLLLQRGGELYAMHDRCTHRGGPLHKGEFDAEIVTCPWHSSCFRLSDGAVLHGPATAPAPSYEARIADGKVEIRRRSV